MKGGEIMLSTKHINLSVVYEFDTEEIQGHDYLDLSKPKKPKATAKNIKKELFAMLEKDDLPFDKSILSNADINKLAGSLERFLNLRR